LLYLTYFLISGMPFQPGRLQGEGMQRWESLRLQRW
jgi:hypothetical protein